MNNYHIYDEIGRGKYSVVYKGRQKKTIEYIAVKSLEKDRRKKLLNEVKIFTDITHDNILKFYKWHETRNHLWVIFEYCAGGDLYQLIEQDKSLPENIVRSFGKDLLQGMAYLHSQGIIYCDLKPSNVLINEFGKLKLSDFGLARRIIDMICTQNGEQDQKRGSPYYMAPELFQDHGVHSFQSDLWALGCVLYELATGKTPFVSKSFKELLNLIVKAPTPVVETFSSDFNDLLFKLLQKDPLNRISWQELANHKFWQQPLQIGKISAQPHFENWVKRYHSQMFFPKQINTLQQQPQNVQQIGTPSNKYSQNKENTLADALNNQAHQQQQQNEKGFNPLRLSLQVMKNQQKQENDYNNQSDKQDVQLLNTNQEIGWGDQKNDDENDVDEFQQQQQQQQQYQYQQQQQNEEEIKVEKLNNLKHIDSNQNTKKKFDQQQNYQQQQQIQQPDMTPQSQKIYKNQSNVSNNSKSPIDGFQTPVAKVKFEPLEKLFTHNTDNQVKPIIGNKDIEKIVEATYNPQTLPFKPYSTEEVIQGVETPLIEEHFERIYASLIPSNNDKLNILSYFETIIQDHRVSNRLINSLFMNLLLKLLKTSRVTNIKIRLASIIGLLIRHSTVIENELSQLGIPGIMIEVLKMEKNEKVKRKAISALGEYLFYAATQIDEDPNNTIWEISNSSYQGLLRTIKNNQEDELVKYYACKTIENTTAQSVTTGTQLASVEVAEAMIQLFFNTKNESLRVCSIVSLTHMTVLNNDLIDVVLDSFSPSLINILKGVDSNPRVQQAFLTIINMQILNSGSLIQCIKNQEQEFTEAIVYLLESPGHVVRGKAILTLILLAKVNARTLIFLTQNKFFQVFEKLQRDNQRYVSQCLYHMQELLDEMLPHILKLLLDEFVKVQNSDLQQFLLDQNYSQQMYRENQQFLPGNLQFLDVIMAYLNSQSLKVKIYDHKYLETIFAFIQFSEVEDQQQQQGDENEQQPGSKIIEDAKSYLFKLYEAIISNQKYVLNNHDFFIKNLLPTLCKKNFFSQQVDLRFNNLKLCINILSLIMSDSHIYDNKKPYGKLLNDILITDIVPNLPMVLNDLDPVPFYGLKLINLLVEQNQQLFVSLFRRQKLNVIFYEYLVQDHPRLTKNTLKIICQFISHQESSLEELMKHNLLQSSIHILKVHVQQQQDWALEDLMGIILLIVKKLFDLLQAMQINVLMPDQTTNLSVFPFDKCQNYLGNFEQILQISDIIFSLLNHSDYNVQEKACQLGMHIIYMFSYQSADSVFSMKSLQNTIQAINMGNQQSNNSQLNQNNSNYSSMTQNNTGNNASYLNSQVLMNLNNVFLKKLVKMLCWGISLYKGRQQPLYLGDMRESLIKSLENVSKNVEDNIINYYVGEIFKNIK